MIRQRADSALHLVGNTPLVKLNRLPSPGSATVLGKLESLNPSGSVKDRVALAIIEEAEASGKLKPGGTLVEATVGNMGVALAMVASVKGYRLVLVIPEGVSQEWRRLLIAHGAQLILTSGPEGMPGAVSTLQTVVRKNPDYFAPQQFDNPATAEAHRRTTAPEILAETKGKVDAFVAGVGTGGTVTGVGEVLKREVPWVRVIGVEPALSPVLSEGRAGRHGIHGLGAGFVPQVLNPRVLDTIMTVRDEDAYDTMARLATEEGLSVGVSSGANVFAALKVAEKLGAGKVVVTIFPDAGERYLRANI